MRAAPALTLMPPLRVTASRFVGERLSLSAQCGRQRARDVGLAARHEIPVRALRCRRSCAPSQAERLGYMFDPLCSSAARGNGRAIYRE